VASYAPLTTALMSAGDINTSAPHNTNKLTALSTATLQVITNLGLFYKLTIDLT
jgi:hypothetical protein